MKPAAAPPTPASLTSEPRIVDLRPTTDDIPAASQHESEPLPIETPDADNSFGGWGVSDWCIGVSDDMQPPSCTDPTGCYKLQLSDLRISVVSVMGRGLALDEAHRHYRAIDAASSDQRIKACFAHEIGRGRPPTGVVRIDIAGTAGECASEDAKIIEKNVGLKTAECVRDALQRYRLPSAVSSAQTVTVGIEVAVEGI